MTDQLSTDLASLKIDRTPPTSRLRFVWPAIALLVVLAVYFSYEPAVRLLRTQVLRPEVQVTEVLRVAAEQTSVRVTSTGYVVPTILTKVGVKLPGRVSAVHVTQGQHVEEGALLVELEKADHEAAVKAALAAVQAARARVHTARAQYAEVSLQAKRQRALANKGVVPSAQAEDLEARATSLAEQIKASEAEVSASQAQMTAQKVNLRYMSLYSPIAGTILSKPPEVGEVLSFDVGALGSALIEVADMRSLVVETDVPEARLHMVHVDTPCEIVLDAFPTQRFRGITDAIMPEVDRAKATATVRVKFVDEVPGVLPNMSARVSFLEAPLDEQQLSAPPKIVVPQSAVVTRRNDKVVFALDNDVATMQIVELGPVIGGGFELRSGPPPGTRIVDNPASNLRDGQRVKEKQ